LKVLKPGFSAYFCIEYKLVKQYFRAAFMILYIGIESYQLSVEIKKVFDHEVLFFTELEDAKRHIYRLILTAQNLPMAIICDAGFEREEIIKFLSRVNFSEAVRVIPFILYSISVGDQEKLILAKMKGVDDVYNHAFTNSENCRKMVERIKFLHLFKNKKNSYIPKKEINEEILPETLIDRFFKRFLDITVSSILLLILSPFLLLIAIIIKIESRGPVFYKAIRAGSNYSIFKFYKFRTMYQDADKRVAELMERNQYKDSLSRGPVFFKISNDPRVTRFGNFLRNMSVDEIPQLINVLKGDMSLVGNRPLPLYEAVSLTQDQWAARFLAPAGMTGLWQITKRGKKEMTVTERIDLDINYADKNTLLRDLCILFKTPRGLLQKDNV